MPRVPPSSAELVDEILAQQSTRQIVVGRQDVGLRGLRKGEHGGHCAAIDNAEQGCVILRNCVDASLSADAIMPMSRGARRLVLGRSWRRFWCGTQSQLALGAASTKDSVKNGRSAIDCRGHEHAKFVLR